MHTVPGNLTKQGAPPAPRATKLARQRTLPSKTTFNQVCIYCRIHSVSYMVYVIAYCSQPATTRPARFQKGVAAST